MALSDLSKFPNDHLLTISPVTDVANLKIAFIRKEMKTTNTIQELFDLVKSKK